MKDCMILAEIENDKMNIVTSKSNLMELMALQGHIQSFLAIEALKKGVRLDDVKSRMLDIHLAAMQSVQEASFKLNEGVI